MSVSGYGDQHRLERLSEEVNDGNNQIENLKIGYLSSHGKAVTHLKSDDKSKIRSFFQKYYELKEEVLLWKEKGNKIPEKTRHILKVSEETGSVLSKKILLTDYLTLSKQKRPDPYHLLKGPSRLKIAPKDFQWQLHCGILRNIYNRSQDPEIKKLINFLIIQYLAKSAHINFKSSEPLLEEAKVNVETMYQLGLIQKSTYIRDRVFFEPYFDELVLNTLESSTSASYGDFYALTDTLSFEELLPLTYMVNSSVKENQQAWSDKMIQAFTLHSELGGDLSSNFKKAILFDLTDYFGATIFKQENRKQEFLDLLKEFRENLASEVNKAAHAIKEKFDISDRDITQISKYLRRNISVISRNEVEGVGVVKMILQESHSHTLEEERRELANEANLKFFLDSVGVRLGAVNGREKVMKILSLEDFIAKSKKEYDSVGEIVEYVPKTAYPTIYRDKKGLIKTNFFEDLKNKIEIYRKKFHLFYPAQTALGGGVLNLIEGLLLSVSDKEFQSIINHPEKNELVQQALYRIGIHLAEANDNFRKFATFSLDMELVLSELTTLLVVFCPFTLDDFSSIYKGQLTHVPDELRPFLKCGIGKSAMNILAGIMVAVGPDSVKGKMKAVYFEESDLINVNRLSETINIEEVELYVCVLNPNITFDTEHYAIPDPTPTIRKLLDSKSGEGSLTVAVDVTIDFVHSQKVRTLLETFSKEIEEGKLNCVVFRSGQKYDMFGMDNYYGAPFYIINNGEKKWDNFNKLLEADSFKVDTHSLQWFSLANKFAFKEMDEYRALIFKNTRSVLDALPDQLLKEKNERIYVVPVDKEIEANFIDLRIVDETIKYNDVLNTLLLDFVKNNQALYRRDSFGFIHTSVSVCSRGYPIIIRINPGLDPQEASTLKSFFEHIAKKYS